jgi:hypothetical protein
MNILVLTNCSWDDTNSVGNTLSNWFFGWENARFSTMYSREEMPNNNCCDSYFRVSPTNIIKNLLTPKKIGIQFGKKQIYAVSKSQKESELINSTRGKRIRNVFIFLSELLYSSKIWMNKKLKQFIQTQNPDLCFAFAISDPFRFFLCKYVKENLSIPLVLLIADDVYGVYTRDRGVVSRRNKKRFEVMIKMADKVYGASEMMCEKYSRLFDIEVKPLYKGCVLSTPKTFNNTPIRLAYAGNLFYGRSQTLGAIAKELDHINKKNKQITAQLEIYTGTPITEEFASMLNVEGSSKIMGQKPYTEIVEILKTADIVLHVESFDKEQIEVVKYSFSTKIIDCLQSGSVLMVVGPKGIASVEYPRTIPGAIVIDDVSDLQVVLSSVLSSPEQLICRAQKTHTFAAETFPIEKVRKRLQSEFDTLIKTTV